MSGALILLTILLPLFLATLSSLRTAPWLVVSAVLPALLLAIFAPLPTTLRLDWLLLGTHLGLDETGRLFLAAAALVWLLTALHAAGSRPDSTYGPRFRVFFQLAMSGNFILILAQDMMTFYLGFTLMGLAAYGLVAHRASLTARRTGRLYLGWTIFGELMLFAALVQLAAQTGATDFVRLQAIHPPQLAVALLVLGFGIKLALPGLHLWLPPTYAAAPAAGVAVLSGPMISAGFLGWLRFLPAGHDSLVAWGEFLIGLGLFGVIFGVSVGLMQLKPKLVLGYSSISKMGLVSTGFGIALAYPTSAPLLLTALVLFVLHHQLVKSALFLGVDLVERHKAGVWGMSGIILLGLALVGAPFTGGALAKAKLASALPEAYAWFSGWMALAAIATTLLMGRLVFLLLTQHRKRPTTGRPVWAAWTCMLGLILLIPFVMGEPHQLFTGSLSLILGVTTVWLVWFYRPKPLARLVGLVPPADILHPVRRLMAVVWLHSAVPLGKFVKTATAQMTKGAWMHRLRESKPAARFRSSKQRNDSNWVGSLWIGLAGLICMVIMI